MVAVTSKSVNHSHGSNAGGADGKASVLADSRADGDSYFGGKRLYASSLILHTSLPPDETVTWKHRCSEFFLLAHVMQLIKPDKMH